MVDAAGTSLFGYTDFGAVGVVVFSCAVLTSSR
jgi:hypothetical protein